jgi:pleckstrin homology domain-containing family A member 1/2
VHSCSPVELKKHANSFVVVLPSRTYYLQASNEGDMQDWVKQVNVAKEALLGTSTQNSVATPIPIPSAKSQTQNNIPRSPIVVGAGTTPSPPSARSVGFAAPVTSESDSEDQLGAENPKAGAITASPSKAQVQASGSATMDPLKVVLSGYLLKCRSKRRGWRKRWFMLTSSALIYSANHMVSPKPI